MEATRNIDTAGRMQRRWRAALRRIYPSPRVLFVYVSATGRLNQAVLIAKDTAPAFADPFLAQHGSRPVQRLRRRHG